MRINLLPIGFSIAVFFLFSGITALNAQTFPTPGFTLPNGETIYITYEVDVNDPLADTVCQIVNQSSVSGSNFMTVLTDDPAFPGSSDPTITPVAQPAQITMCPNDTTLSASLD